MFDFSQDEFRFWIDDLLIVFRSKKRYLMLCGIGKPGHGDHLRFEIPPEDADVAFDLRPHVTARLKGGRTRRPFRMKLPWGRVVRFLEELGHALHEAWREATQPVDLDELTEQDLVTVEASDEEHEELLRAVVQRNKRGEYRLDLSRSTFNKELDFLERNLRLPCQLEPKGSEPGLYPVFRIDEETGIEQIGQLNYFSRGLPDGRAPGWYMTDLRQYQQATMEAFYRATGAKKIIGTLRRIKMALGHGPELSDRVESLLAESG